MLLVLNSDLCSQDNVSFSFLRVFHLRVLHCFPLQPEGQEQMLGPTHFPPFMHMGSQIP